MIGKAYWATFKFFDIKTHKMAFKKRPVLVIGEADTKDWVVLPISRITRKEHLDLHYDFEIDKTKYSKLFLKETSYIRTHKQTTINEGEFSDCILDFKKEYEETYIEVLALVEEFQKNLIAKAL